MKKLVLLVICFLAVGVHAQKRNPKQKKSDHFTDRHNLKYSYTRSPYHPYGLQFAVGATYTFTDLNPDQQTAVSSGGDTTYNFYHDPKGRFGYYFDIGMHHFFKKPNKIIRYWDWALGMKHFAGQEEYKGSLKNSAGQTDSQYGIGKWDNGYVFARVNIHNMINLGKYNFLDNSLGINADFQAYEYDHNRTYEGDNSNTNQHFQSEFITGLHYRLGFGIKMREGFFIIPFAEVPIITAHEWNNAKPVIRWFSSWYMPFTLGVKFAFLKKRNPNDCPTVGGSKSDKEKSEQYQQQR